MERTTATWQKENAVYTEKLDSMLELQRLRLELDRDRLEFERELAGLKKKKTGTLMLFKPWN